MNQKGLSLTELVVTLAMVSTLAGLALPAYQPLIDRQHAQVAANELASALRSARTEAILRNQTVLIHPLSSLLSAHEPGKSSSFSPGSTPTPSALSTMKLRCSF